MSFLWMIIAGLTCSAAAKLLMPRHRASGLFILGISGAIIAFVMQYSRNQPTGFITPFAGAIIMLGIYAATARRPVARKVERIDRDEFRRAA
jgi:uncharacterized membrane protein YeaQ/YmgE (transglycosylase-associated protein family)